ncbi:MAG: alpha-amylase family protein [Bacteroidales bacterium]
MENNPIQGKAVIYQLFVRLFGNKNDNNKIFGKIDENGCGKFNDINEAALNSIEKLGATHIWFTGIIEHATCTDYSGFNIPNDNPAIVKGIAGSPYAIKNYYQVDPDLADDVDNRMTEFENLIERCHNKGLKVIIDFVPNHVARHYYTNNISDNIEAFGKNDDSNKSFDPQNNFYYLPGNSFVIPEEVNNLPYTNSDDINNYKESPAKATGNDCFSNKPSINDWYETVKLNYGVDYQNNKEKHFDPLPSTWQKMTHILLYWAEKGVDGFRCDMAEMVPAEFWNHAISKVKAKHPDSLFIAEIYNPNAYKEYIETGKFDLLYDKEGLYNTLRNIIEGNATARLLTLCWQNLNGLDAKMLRFLENHDEQRIASSHFADDPWRGIPAMVLCTTFNKGAVMNYFGQELGERAQGETGYSGDDGRTSIYDYCSLPPVIKWNNNGAFNEEKLDENTGQLRQKYSDIYTLAKRPEIMNGNFYDLMWVNPDHEEFAGNHIYTYLRYTDEKVILFVINFSKDELLRTRIKIPEDFFELANLNDYFDVFGKDILNAEKMFTCDKNELLNNGLVINAEANTAYAFELEFLK